MKRVELGDREFRFGSGVTPRSQLVPAPPSVGATLFCPDCEDWHEVRVIVYEGHIPGWIAIGAGPGGGWWYRLTGEDRGVVEGLSVPIYRAAYSIADAVVADLRAQQSGVTH